jgi:hypothetical protein
MRTLYLEEYRTGTGDREPDSLMKKIWKFGWGGVFIATMTILSECGPHTVYSKVASGPAPGGVQSRPHCILK